MRILAVVIIFDIILIWAVEGGGWGTYKGGGHSKGWSRQWWTSSRQENFELCNLSLISLKRRDEAPGKMRRCYDVRSTVIISPSRGDKEITATCCARHKHTKCPTARVKVLRLSPPTPPPPSPPPPPRWRRSCCCAGWKAKCGVLVFPRAAATLDRVAPRGYRILSGLYFLRFRCPERSPI